MEQRMVAMRFVVDADGHQAGDVVRVSRERSLELLKAGTAVVDAKAPKVERGVVARQTRTAVVRR
jgi:hypothetical protein